MRPGIFAWSLFCMSYDLVKIVQGNELGKAYPSLLQAFTAVRDPLSGERTGCASIIIHSGVLATGQP